jgi:hypothetical protein
MAQLGVDVSGIAPDMGFETIPAGWYNVMIDESDLKPTKDGAGAFLQLRFNVLDGQYKGRKVFARLNIRNANPQTVEIAYKQLSAIGHAVNVLQIQDSQQLHNLPMKIKVKVRPAEGNYEEANDITAYRNINDPAGTQSGPGAGAPAANAGGWQPPTGGFAPPAGAAPAPQAPQAQWQPPAGAPPAAPAAPAAQPWQQPQQQQPQAPQAAPQPQWQAPPAQQQAPAPQAQPPQGQWQPPAPQSAPVAPPQGAAPGAPPPWQQPKQ